MFVATKLGVSLEADIALIAPLAVSFVVYAGIGLYNQYCAKQPVKPEIEKLMAALSDKNA